MLSTMLIAHWLGKKLWRALTEAVPSVTGQQELDMKCEARGLCVTKNLYEGDDTSVVLMHHKELQKRYVLKNIYKSTFTQESCVEVIVMDQVKDHSYLVHAIDRFETAHSHCLLMEYFERGDLADYLESESQLTIDQMKYVLAQIILALDVLHSTYKLIHRDIKKDNIFVRGNGTVALGDFDLVSLNSTSDSVVGTDGYMAPEVIRGELYDSSVDFFSLGALAYVIYHDDDPEWARSDDDHSMKLTAETVSEVTESTLLMDDEMPDDLKDLIENLMSMDPKFRLGAGPDGMKKLKSHPFFAAVCWEQVEQGIIPKEGLLM